MNRFTNTYHYIVFTVLLSSGCGAQKNGSDTARTYDTGPLPEAFTVPYRHCDSDSDCVFVNNGCCDCANGGRELAVNKAALDAFKKRIICPKVTICTERGRTPPCGAGAVSCENHRCVYRITSP